MRGSVRFGRLAWHDAIPCRQVPRRVSSLRSHAVFVLRSKRGGWFLWCGRGSTGDDREMAKRVAINAGGGGDLAVVYEGQEKDEFWMALGGSAVALDEFAADGKGVDEQADDQPDSRPARLFACLGASSSAFAGERPRAKPRAKPRPVQGWGGGNARHCLPHNILHAERHASLAVEELPNVSQEELCPEEILIVDARDIAFVWIGRHASREARQKATTLAIEFLKTGETVRVREL